MDGTGYTAPQVFNWEVGSSHTLAVTSPQAGTPGTRHPFAAWSDGGAQSHNITVTSSPATYSANFGTQYQLMLNAGANGSIIPASGNWYAPGVFPSIISTASNSGYVFDRWTLDSGNGPLLNANSAATQVMMNGPNTVSASFKAVTTTLSAAITGRTGTINGSRTWDITLTNTGGATVSEAKLEGLSLSLNGRCQPTATTSFPVSLGDIAAGSSATGQVSVNFAGCAKLARFNVSVSYSANGGTSTGVTQLTGVNQ